MEPTITQNSALYLAHRKASKRRAALFRRLRIAASKKGPDVRRQLTSRDLFSVLHRDKGAESARLSLKGDSAPS